MLLFRAISKEMQKVPDLDDMQDIDLPEAPTIDVDLEHRREIFGGKKK